MSKRGCDLLVGLFLLSSIVATTEAAELPSIRDFVKHAEIRSVTVSPEGTYIAISQQNAEIEALTILKSSSLEHVSSLRFNEHEGFIDVMWANEEKLLLSPTYRLSESRRAKYPTGVIAVVDADGTDLEVIFRSHYRRHILSNGIYVRRTFSGSGRVIDLVPENPELVVMESRGSTPKGIYNAALKINVRTGTITRLAISPVRNGRFVTDSNHRIGFVGGYDAERNYELHHRDPASGNFSLIDETPMKLGDRRPVLPYGSEGTYVFSESSTNATTRLVAWNPLTKFHEVLFHNKEADWESYYTRVDRSIWSVRYFDHFPKYAYVDESSPLTKLHRAFTASFPDDNVELINQSDDETLSTIYVSGPTNSGVFYVVKTNEHRVVTQLKARPSLKGVVLAEMMPLEVKARDGMTIRGYVTLPVGQQTQLPLIVLVHDGPYGVYDKWEYNSEVQLFASRGYAVLQVNYRGSGGRGLSFKNAGYGQWGLAMQDDITDVVKYTISQGTVSADKICIMGSGHYGGYAALAGLYRDPDLYRCGIGVGGAYDLELLFEQGDIRRALWGPTYLKATVGTNSSELRSWSPIYNAERIKAAVMLVHGGQDTRAPIKHARRMRRALRSAGNPPTWLVKSGEGRGFFNEENRVDVYTKVIEFFDEHLGKSR